MGLRRGARGLRPSGFPRCEGGGWSGSTGPDLTGAGGGVGRRANRLALVDAGFGAGALLGAPAPGSTGANPGPESKPGLKPGGLASALSRARIEEAISARSRRAPAAVRRMVTASSSSWSLNKSDPQSNSRIRLWVRQARHGLPVNNPQTVQVMHRSLSPNTAEQLE